MQAQLWQLEAAALRRPATGGSRADAYLRFSWPGLPASPQAILSRCLQRVYAAQYTAEQLAFLERKKSSGGSVAPAAAPVSLQARAGSHIKNSIVHCAGSTGASMAGSTAGSSGRWLGREQIISNGRGARAQIELAAAAQHWRHSSSSLTTSQCICAVCRLVAAPPLPPPA